MRRRAIAGLLLCCLTLAPAMASARVVLVGIDGAGWPLIDAGIADGTLPNFAALAARGITANLETVEPLNSPTVWTTIATGRDPDAHGVTDFFHTRLAVRVPTVFERLAVQGKRVGLFDYLITWPPPRFEGGFAVPGWLARDDRVAPADLFERVGLEPYSYSMQGVRSRLDFQQNARREVAEKPGRWNRLASAFDLDVGAVTFYSVDATGHRFWQAAFPEEFEEPPSVGSEAYKDVIHETLRGVDRALGEIAGALGPDDTLLVASDHAFEARDEVDRVWTTHFEEFLPILGLDPRRDGFHVDGEFFALTLRVLPGPFGQRDALLNRLVAMLRNAKTKYGHEIFQVEVIDMIDRPSGKQRGIVARMRQWAVRFVVEHFFDTKLDRPAHAYIIAIPQDEALRRVYPKEHIYLAGKKYETKSFAHVEEFSGDHHETAIFLGAGGPLRHIPERQTLSVLDIAPTIFYLAGTAVPDDQEGRVPQSFIEPAHLAAHEVERVPASEMPGLPPEAVIDGPDDAVLLERLRALGYAR